MHSITSLSSMPVMLTVKVTAESFGIAQHFVRQLALSGKVMAVRAGKKILINQSSVADYFNNNYLYGQQLGINKQQKSKNSGDIKRPSTAPQKYKIKKKVGNNHNVFGFGNKNGNNGLPHTYTNGFFGLNKRLPSPMISGQKFGMTQKLKFNSYRLPMTNNNIFTFKVNKGI